MSEAGRPHGQRRRVDERPPSPIKQWRSFLKALEDTGVRFGAKQLRMTGGFGRSSNSDERRLGEVEIIAGNAGSSVDASRDLAGLEQTLSRFGVTVSRSRDAPLVSPQTGNVRLFRSERLLRNKMKPEYVGDLALEKTGGLFFTPNAWSAMRYALPTRAPFGSRTFWLDVTPAVDRSLRVSGGWVTDLDMFIYPQSAPYERRLPPELARTAKPVPDIVEHRTGMLDGQRPYFDGVPCLGYERVHLTSELPTRPMRLRLDYLCGAPIMESRDLAPLAMRPTHLDQPRRYAGALLVLPVSGTEVIEVQIGSDLEDPDFLMDSLSGGAIQSLGEIQASSDFAVVTGAASYLLRGHVAPGDDKISATKPLLPMVELTVPESARTTLTQRLGRPVVEEQGELIASGGHVGSCYRIVADEEWTQLRAGSTALNMPDADNQVWFAPMTVQTRMLTPDWVRDRNLDERPSLL